MSFCCNRLEAANQPVLANRSCLQKPLTKAALLVTSLLFAGGAVASHFAGLGIPGIVAFSIGSAGAAGFAIALYIRACLKEAQLNAYKERVGNAAIEAFQNHAEEGVVAVAKKLQPLFDEAGEDKEKLLQCATVVAVNGADKYVPLFVAEVLERVEWQDLDVKEEVLPVALGRAIIANDCITLDYPTTLVGSEGSFRVNKLHVPMKRLIGRGDFNKNPIELPHFSLVKGIEHAIRIVAEDYMAKLKKMAELKKGKVDDETPIGFELEIAQSTECRFPASMVVEILPDLHNLPGLLKVTMTDVGAALPFSQPTDEQNGFRDNDLEVLNDFILNNYNLIEIEINTSGMSDAEATFERNRDSLIAGRAKSREDILQMLLMLPTQKPDKMF